MVALFEEEAQTKLRPRTEPARSAAPSGRFTTITIKEIVTTLSKYAYKPTAPLARRKNDADLYWQTALDEFSHGPHRHDPTRPVLDLAKIDGEPGTRNFEWHLPKTLPDDLHYYHDYRTKVGDESCNKRGIDTKASIALVMVGVHEAPQNGKPSDCTYGTIYGKNRRDFGQSTAPSKRLFMFVYRDLKAESVPILAKIGLQGSLKEGWYTFRLDQPANVLLLGAPQMAPLTRFKSRQMFPMLP